MERYSEEHFEGFLGEFQGRKYGIFGKTLVDISGGTPIGLLTEIPCRLFEGIRGATQWVHGVISGEIPWDSVSKECRGTLGGIFGRTSGETCRTIHEEIPGELEKNDNQT